MRYSGPRGKGFYGEIGRAQALQRFADKLVGRVIARIKAPPLNGNGFLTDRLMMDDGSVIHASVNMLGVHPIIRTWIESPSHPVIKKDGEIILPIYAFLETGLAYFPDSLESGDSIVVHPLSSQVQGANAVSDALIDEMKEINKTGGYASFHYRNEFKSGTPVTSLALPAVETPWTNEYAPGAATGVANPYYRYMPHLCQYWTLNGKLKQFMQAKLWKLFNPTGTNDFDYDDVTLFIRDKLWNGAVAVPQTKLDSMALYSAGFGDYFLISIESGVVKARRLAAISGREEDMESLKLFSNNFGTQSVLYQRYESYAMTMVDFSIGDPWVTLGDVNAIGGEYSQSLWYGWKANREGSELSIVTHLADRLGAHLLGPINACLATISFAPTVVSIDGTDYSSLEMSVSTVEKTWVPDGRTPVIWIPKVLDPGVTHQYWWSHECQDSFSVPAHGDNAPLYCYYTETDQLAVIGFDYTPPEEFTFTDQSVWVSENFNGSAENPETHVVLDEVQQMAKASLTFRLIGSAKTPRPFKDIGTVSEFDLGLRGYNKNYARFDFNIENLTPCTSICVMSDSNVGIDTTHFTNWLEVDSECGLVNPCKVTAYYGSATMQLDIGTNMQMRDLTSLVIPYGNSEAVYLFSLQIERDFVSRQGGESDGVYMARQESTGITNWYEWNQGNWIGGGVGGCPSAQTMYTDSLGEEVLTVRREYCDRFGNNNLGDLVSSGNLTSPPLVANGLETLFSPRICGSDPYSEFPGFMLSMTSLEGLRFHQTETNRNSITPPYGITSNFEHEWDHNMFNRKLFAGWQ